MKFYAGIGSRQTPQKILNLMTQVATKLHGQGWTLRSGAAKGADTAFEKGAGDKKEIFTARSDIPAEAYKIAESMHPRWDLCSEYARSLHARNSMIILGPQLVTPVRFVIAYQVETIDRGGTRLGMNLAKSRGILVLNLWKNEERKRVLKYLHRSS